MLAVRTWGDGVWNRYSAASDEASPGDCERLKTKYANGKAFRDKLLQNYASRQVCFYFQDIKTLFTIILTMKVKRFWHCLTYLYFEIILCPHNPPQKTPITWKNKQKTDGIFWECIELETEKEKELKLKYLILQGL